MVNTGFMEGNGLVLILPKRKLDPPAPGPYKTPKRIVPQKNKFVGSTESSQGRGPKVRNCRN